MNLSRIAVFVEVVKQGGFAAAARELDLSAPAVSKHVQALESELGVRLLNRTTRRMVLTEEGGVYYEGARKALDDLNETEQAVMELKSTPSGRVKINAPMSFGREYLTAPLARFAHTYPQVELDVDFSDRWVDVIGEAYDLVVRVASLEDSNLIARKLAPCPIVLCAAPSLLSRYKTVTKPEQVSDLPAVTYNRHQSEETWVYRAGQDKGRIKLNKRLACNTAEMQLAACLEGVGVALLPIFSAHAHLANGALQQCLPDYVTEPERGIYLMYPPNRQASLRMKLLVNHLLDEAGGFKWCQ